MPKLASSQITFAEFHQRLHYAVENYTEYVKHIKADQHTNRPIDWLDNFLEFMDLSALESRK